MPVHGVHSPYGSGCSAVHRVQRVRVQERGHCPVACTKGESRLWPVALRLVGGTIAHCVARCTRATDTHTTHTLPRACTRQRTRVIEDTPACFASLSAPRRSSKPRRRFAISWIPGGTRRAETHSRLDPVYKKDGIEYTRPPSGILWTVAVSQSLKLKHRIFPCEPSNTDECTVIRVLAVASDNLNFPHFRSGLFDHPNDLLREKCKQFNTISFGNEASNNEFLAWPNI